MKPYYEDESVTIYHGDALGIAPNLAPVDLVFTSPPYLNQRDYETFGGKDWASVVPPILALTPHHETTQVVVNLGIVHRDGEVCDYWNDLIREMRREGWKWFGFYAWDQGFGLPGDWNGRFAPSHELLFHFCKSAIKLNKSAKCVLAGGKGGKTFRKKDGSTKALTRVRDTIPESKVPDSVVRVNRSGVQDGYRLTHPAVFPEELARFVLAAFPGQTILDPFMGSGTTLRAAKDLGKRAIGIDIEEPYCKLARRRMAQGALDFGAP